MSKALFKSTSTVSAMTFISRILGFVRDMIAAQLFGVNAATDAFSIAFKIPNFMRNLFAEGSFSQAFVPVLSEYKEKQTREQIKNFISHISAGLGLALLIITIIAVIWAHGVITIFAPGLDPYRFNLASEMLRITFPYALLISLTALGGAILNTYGKFAVYAFTPALLNIVLIITAYTLSSHFSVPIMSQAWGILIAGFVQLFFQLPFLKNIGLLTLPRLNWHDPGVKRVLTLMLPALFGSSVGQISLLLNTIFASFLKIGSVTWLYYSDRLAYFPLGVFGVALATVVLPQLSRHHAKQSPQSFSATIDWGLRCNLLIGLPASLTMLMLSGPLVTSLFQYGHKFTAFDVFMTQRSVIAYSIGLQAFMLAKVLSTSFYAKQDIKTPVKIGVVSLIINMILNVVLMFPLAHAGLALASSLSSWINVILLGWMLHRRNIYSFQSGSMKFILQLLIANGLLALFFWFAAGDTLTWISWHWTQRVLHLLFLGITGIIIYFSSLWLSGMRPSDFKVKG
jgi:putative peptidoglycan lipid II flippase